MNTTNILLRHNQIEIDHNHFGNPGAPISRVELATVLVNLAYYGRGLNVEAYQALQKFTSSDLKIWWLEVECQLKEITGDNRNIGDFVVYKNFPAEVLSKSEAEYWLPQILMYCGFPKEFFTEEVQPREKMSEDTKPVILSLAKHDSFQKIYESYARQPARWKTQELNEVVYLSSFVNLAIENFVFKENLILLASHLIASGKKIHLSNATDVLRLAVGLSGGDVSFATNSKLKNFKRAERRYLLALLEECNNLAEDVARRPEHFKRLFFALHPGDWKKSYPGVVKVMNAVSKDDLVTFNSKVEAGLASKDESVLELLAGRPGEFRRRLTHTLSIFGEKAAKAFAQTKVLDKLTVMQLVSLRSHLDTVNLRDHRIFPPKGNWSKLQVADAKSVDQRLALKLSAALTKALVKRVPKVKVLDPQTKMVKLPNNGDVGYPRGTSFKIPDDVKFIRTASYWQNEGHGVTWFDNGWNFFNSEWQPLGSCCWTNTNYGFGSAIFSGDPVNTTEMKGRAAQLIDLYPEKLLKAGVKYAVWNILCYSRIPFSKAQDVFAALQWGVDPQKGKLFEPSRCQLSFPLTSEHYTKYVCVLNLETREMIYIDANLKSNTSAASTNGIILEKQMPAYMEYIDSLPSVHDLFKDSVDLKSDLKVLYSDKDVELNGEKAYVFKPENENNTFTQFDLNQVLSK